MSLLGLLFLLLSWTISEEAYARDVLLVLNPAFSFEEHLTLVDELQQREHRIHLVGLTCAAPGLDSLSEHILAKERQIAGPYTLIAHGIAASVALQTAPSLRADELILLAPVLDIYPSRAHQSLAAREVTETVSLAKSGAWNEGDEIQALFGQGEWKGCLSMQVAREIQTWMKGNGPVLKLGAIEQPVWVGTSLGDEFSPVEGLVPASRNIPHRQLVRFGINRLDPKDYGHGEFITSKKLVKAAVKRIGSLH